MTDMLCGYTGDREGILMAYLYDEISPEDRESFERHLGSCARCRVELGALGGVRAQLARWSPPDFMSGRQSALERPSTVVPLPSRVFDAGDDSQPANAAPKSWWREMPAWTQVAAAMLVFGVSAGLANINVHYDAQSGLNVRTGWGSTPTPAPSNAAGPINTDNLA